MLNWNIRVVQDGIVDTVPKLSILQMGRKSYELTDHLGNVLATVSDRKLGVGTTVGQPVSYWRPDIITASDYYPFGMSMYSRNKFIGQYRYGFNGKENDNDIKGNGNQQDYGMRIYACPDRSIWDPRIGKFLSVDPISKEFPWYTPYQFAGNKPIANIDLDGLEETAYTQYLDKAYSNPETAKAATIAQEQITKSFISGTGKILYEVLAGTLGLTSALLNGWNGPREVDPVKRAATARELNNLYAEGVVNLAGGYVAKTAVKAVPFGFKEVLKKAEVATKEVDDLVVTARIQPKIQATTLREFKNVVKSFKEDYRLNVDEVKQFESLTEKFGGKIRFDENPTTGRVRVPHISIEGITPTVKRQHLFLSDEAINYLKSK